MSVYFYRHTQILCCCRGRPGSSVGPALELPPPVALRALQLPAAAEPAAAQPPALPAAGMLALPPPPADAVGAVAPGKKVAGKSVAEMSEDLLAALAKRKEPALLKRPAAAVEADRDEEHHMFKKRSEDRFFISQRPPDRF